MEEKRIAVSDLKAYERFRKNRKVYEVRSLPFTLGAFTFLTVWDIERERGTRVELRYPKGAYTTLILEDFPGELWPVSEKVKEWLEKNKR